jgi:DNA end-binding protein Ku
MRLSLVSFPVALYPVVASSSRIAFHQLQKGTGCRIRERKVCGASGDEVPNDDIVKGYEYEKDHYVVLDDADLEKVRLETKKTIELIQFFQAADVDPVYYDKPYYVVPDGTMAEEAYTVVREALARSGQAALGRVVLSGRERLTAILPRDKGFVLHTLHANDLVRKPGAYFSDIHGEVGAELADEVAVAEQLIARKTAPFDPRKFVDRYEEALRAIIDEKLKGQEPTVVEPGPAQGNVVNLMEALKRSLGEGGERAAG